MALENIIYTVLIVGGFGSTIYMNKRWFVKTDHRLDNISKKVDDMVQCHHECRAELPEKYASRPENIEKIKSVCGRLDDHERRISFHEGKNGAGPG